MAIEVINPTEDARYDNFVREHPASTIYHHSAWKLLIESTFKSVSPYYLASYDKYGNMNGMLPGFISNKAFSNKKYISLPLATHCDPLFYSDDVYQKCIQYLLQNGIHNDVDLIELYCLNQKQLLKDERFVEYGYYLTHILKLQKNIHHILMSFQRDSIRRYVKKVMNSGLILEYGRNLSDVKIFYRLLTLNRKKNGFPPLPYCFFKIMWEIFYPKNLIALLLVKNESQYIAGALLLKYKDHIYNEYSASDQNYLRIHPNHFLYWKSIEYAHQSGYSYYHFGRSSVDNEGLVAFKRKWGTEERQLYYYYYPHVHSLSAESRESLKFKLMKLLCRRMPIKVLQRIGDFAYQYIY